MFSREHERVFSTLVVSIILVVGTTCFFGFKPISKASPDWLSGWQYRKSHVINSSSGAGQDYQACIKAYKGTGVDGTETVCGVLSGKVYLGSNVRDDFGDVRFTGSDGTTELRYWLQEFTSGESAVFWVRVADSLDSSPVTIYIYYGKSDAATTSSGTDTFIAFSDFESGVDGWTNIDLDTFERTTTESFRGSYSLHCKRALVTDVPADAYKSVSFPSTYCYQIAFSINGTSELELSVYYSGAIGYENGVRLYPYGGAFRYKLGATPSQSCNTTYSTNTWYIGQIRRTNASNWELAYYNSSGSNIWEKTDCSFAPTQTIDRLGVSPENNNDLYIDNTFVRRYTSNGNEPAQGTWGNEETSAMATIQVTPSLVEKNSSDIGKTFNLNATIQNVMNLWGFDYNLTWDSSLLTLVNVDFTTTLDAMWGPGNWFAASNKSGPGNYKLAAISLLNGFNSTASTPLTVLMFRSEDPLTGTDKNTTIHFDTHKLSDSNSQPIPHVAQDGLYKITIIKPILSFSPIARTCRKYGESFTVEVSVSAAPNITGFKFEIDFNTTLLDCANMSWNAWGTGTMVVDEANGNATGLTSGTVLNGTLTLVTIEFKAACYHIWKNLTDWVNDQDGTVFIQWANLTRSGGQELGYVKGGLNQIDVGPDVVYTFAPIQGDVDNDGDVDIFDLRTVAYYYDQINETYNLTGSSTIDVFDLVVISSNFGYEYDP